MSGRLAAWDDKSARWSSEDGREAHAAVEDPSAKTSRVPNGSAFRLAACRGRLFAANRRYPLASGSAVAGRPKRTAEVESQRAATFPGYFCKHGVKRPGAAADGGT